MAAKKSKHPKMDKLLISKEPHEILYVRLMFYKVSGVSKLIGHPSSKDIIAIAKIYNHSRRKVYDHLVSVCGYQKIK